MIERIVVGVDGSDGSQRALHWAAGRAKELGAEVIAVFAVSPVTEFIMTIPPLSPDIIHELKGTLERDWCRPLRDTGVRYRSTLTEEDPVHALLETAEREPADMLVLGAHSRGGFADRLLGSVTYKVAHRAHCPVVIIPPDDAGPSAP